MTADKQPAPDLPDLFKQTMQQLMHEWRIPVYWVNLSPEAAKLRHLYQTLGVKLPSHDDH